MIPMLAFGEENGGNLTYTLDNGTLTITGAGNMTSAPWTGQEESVSKVIIEGGVSSICDSDFQGFTRLLRF